MDTCCKLCNGYLNYAELFDAVTILHYTLKDKGNFKRLEWNFCLATGLQAQCYKAKDQVYFVSTRILVHSIADKGRMPVRKIEQVLAVTPRSAPRSDLCPTDCYHYSEGYILSWNIVHCLFFRNQVLIHDNTINAAFSEPLSKD